MNPAPDESCGFQQAQKRKEAELVQVSRKRDGLAIEKSADQMDKIQYASKRDLAIRNVDRESTLLRQVKAAMRRIHEGSFELCDECESTISPKRLAAVPWAPRVIQCQEATDRGLERERKPAASRSSTPRSRADLAWRVEPSAMATGNSRKRQVQL
jgi:DnaK suppressor protein